MIHKVGQIMLYVNDQDAAVQFWTEKAGFTVLDEENNGDGMRWIEIAPKKDAETSIVLHNKEFVAKISPGLHLATPSIMFFTNELDHLYCDLVTKQVEVGEIVSLPTGRVFNFADYESNFFAVMEKNN